MKAGKKAAPGKRDRKEPFERSPTSAAGVDQQVTLPGDKLRSAVLKTAGTGVNITGRNEAEETELLTQFIVDRVAESVFLTDHLGRFLYVNDTACAYLGYTREELLAMSVPDIGPNLPANKWEEHWREIKERGSFTIETVHRRKDGSLFPIEITFNYFKYGDQEYNVGLARDITERTRLHSALKEDEEFFRKLSENISDGILLHDNGITIEVNEGFARRYGYEREEMIGKPALDFIHPDYHELTLQKSIEGYEGTYEILALRGDGSPVPMEVSVSEVPYHGRDVRVVAMKDISERKRHEEELRSSETRFRDLFEKSPAALFSADLSRLKEFIDELRASGVTDLRSYIGSHPDAAARFATMMKIVDVNEAAVELFEAGGREGLLSGMMSIFSEESYAAICEMLQSFSQGARFFENETVSRTLKGNYREIQIRLTLNEAYADSWSSVLIAINDITKLKEAEQGTRAQRDLARELADSSSLEEVLRVSIRHAVRIPEIDCVGIYLVDEVTGDLDLACWEGHSDEFLESVRHRSASSDTARSLSEGKIIQVSIRDAEPPLSDMLRAEGLRSVAAFPVMHKGKVVASLNVGSRTAEELPFSSQRVLEAFAAQVGASIDRVRSAEALRHQFYFLQKIIDTIPNPTFFKGADGRYLGANSAYEQLVGMTSEYLIGKTVFDVAPLERAYVHDKSDRELLARPGVQTYESVVTDPKGREREAVFTKATYRNANGTVGGIVGVILDITERKRAEEALRESEQKYRFLIESLNEGIWAMDLDGVTTFVNERMSEMLGYAVRELVGKPLFAFLRGGEAEQAQPGFVGERLGIEEDVDYQFQKKDGSLIYARMHAAPILDGKGNVVGSLAGILDVTEKKRAQERQQFMVQLLELINRSGAGTDPVSEILHTVKEFTGIEAIGIRLKQGDDFPYYETSGFPAEFAAGESSLHCFDESGDIITDSRGRPHLDCMCGSVILGRTDPSQPYFTEGGSFWTNSTSELIATTTETDRAKRRDHCNAAGYESMALVPLKSADQVIGLLQLNDHRRGVFTEDYIRFFEEMGESIGIAIARKETEEALRESEKRYEQHFRDSTDVILSIGGGPRLLSVSPSVERLLGYTPEEIIGRPFDELNFIAPESLERFVNDSLNVLSGESTSPSEYVFRAKDGTRKVGEVRYTPLVRDGDIVGLVGMIRDITERKKAEEALRDSEERFREVFEKSPLGIAIIDVNFKFQEVNKTSCEMLGYSEEELAMLTFAHITYRDDVDDLVEVAEKMRDGEIGSFNLEKRFRRKDGDILWLSVTASLMRYEDGNQSTPLLWPKTSPSASAWRRSATGSTRSWSAGWWCAPPSWRPPTRSWKPSATRSPTTCRPP